MTPSRRERRTRERRACSLYLQFVNHRTGELVGSLADITPDGFRLESTRPIRLQVDYVFRVDVPRDLCDRPFIKLLARSRWSRPDPFDSRLYHTGFEIVGVDADDVYTVERIIERYGSNATGIDSRSSYLWGR